MENKRILLIGGTGYIGTCLLEHLRRANFDVSCLIRKKSIHKIHGKNTKYFVGDLLDKESLIKATEGMDMVISLASVGRTVKKSRYKENVIGLQNLIFAMHQNNVPRLIYYSTLNVNLRDKGYYASSKAMCEKLVMNSRIDYVLIRPSYVYGIDKKNDFYRMGKMISLFRIAPIIGDGNYKIQPVCKDDLAAITLNCVTTFRPNSIIEVAGSETVAINEVVSLIEDVLGKKALKIKIPVILLKLLNKLVPFDVEGFTEDKISTKPFDFNYTSFSQNLIKIANLR